MVILTPSEKLTSNSRFQPKNSCSDIIKKDEVMKNRFLLIDELRGIGLIYVVIFHIIYDLTYIFPIGIKFMELPWMNILREIMVGMLILISGISCNFSRSNFKRSIITLGFAVLISIVTYIMGEQYFISFGILHFLGVSMLIYALFQKIVVKIPIKVGLLCFGLLFMLFKVNASIFYPSDAKHTFWNFMIGRYPDSFLSSDYYPLLPWIFIFFAGTYLGKWIIEDKNNEKLTKNHSKTLCLIGQHTMIIYLLHQPIIYGMMYILW